MFPNFQFSLYTRKLVYKHDTGDTETCENAKKESKKNPYEQKTNGTNQLL